MAKWSFFLVLNIIFTANIALGQTWSEEKLNQEVRRISDLLRCPTCQGLSVKESESLIADSMKGEIKRLLLAGSSEDEILNFFEERYGEWILREPKTDGTNILAWIMPFVFFGGGILFLGWFLKSRFRVDNK